MEGRSLVSVVYPPKPLLRKEQCTAVWLKGKLLVERRFIAELFRNSTFSHELSIISFAGQRHPSGVKQDTVSPSRRTVAEIYFSAIVLLKTTHQI
jgi:hypothetical protein